MEKLKLRGGRCAAFVMLAIFMVFSLGSFAQQKSLQGKVTDNTGSPIPGATVVVKGTTVGTVTNLDGAYQLDVPASATVLTFSYIGMKSQDVTIGSQTVINMALEPEVFDVDEVVVVGYGTRMKEELTGAVSSVNAEQMQVSTAPSVVSRIQGQVSGVTITSANRPGGDATIRIRGIGTINNSNPLYIIDGVPAGPGNNLNPNDVESISILKDASSAAIYGTRGANGVVIITTKKGKDNQQANITFSARTGLTQPSNRYDLLNTQEYGEALWLSYANRNMTPKHAQYGNGPKPVIPDYILPAGAKEGDASVNPSLYKYPDYQIFKASKQGTDWYDEIYRNGVVQEYDLSVSGGGKNATYAFSGNFLDEDGYLIHTNFKRYSFRMNSDAKFNSWFKAGETLQVIYIDEHGRFTDNAEDSSLSDAYRMQPIIPVYDINGNFAGTRAPEMGNGFNPVARLYRQRNDNGKYNRILGSVFGEITFMKGLTGKSLLGYNWGQWNYKGYSIPSFEFSEPDKVNDLYVNSNYSFQWNWTNTLSYSATFADIHKLNVVVGTEAIENKYQELNASRSQYFSEDPGYMQLNSGEINKDNSGYGSEWSLFSQFGRVNYDLAGKYFLEGTVRRDGSSRFSEANRYGVFPAVSAAWALSQENFMAGTQNWLDLLKVRVGYGVSGNDQIGNYNSYTTYASNKYVAAYAFDGSNTSAVAGFQPSTLGNEDVTWEKTKTLNFGIDATLLNKTLNFSFDVWDRVTSDMLIQEPIPNVMGLATAPNVNIGEMDNRGFDVELGYNNSALNGKLKYHITATASHYKNEIVKLFGDPKKTVDAGSLRQMTYTRYAIGTQFPEFFGYIVDGIIQTDSEAAAAPKYGDEYTAPGHFKFRDISGPDGKPDGKITADDRTFIGSPHPDLVGGLNVDLAYGNFDLNLFFYGSYGNEVVNYVKRWIDYGMFNGGLSKAALYDSWGSPHVNKADATLPMLDFNDISQQPSTEFLEDGSFFRLKNLRLGYTVPASLLSKAQIKGLRLYVQGTNLFTLTKYTGLDPELNSSGSGMGLDQGAWPTARQFMFGINLDL
ncbi:MAG TPA: TonB-dependent receptor [Prolixibacteraceae bacterium]|nr:TonB-dependent receptor [Prolixibacteraceae bacterium]